MAVLFWWAWDDLGTKPTFVQIAGGALFASFLGWAAYRRGSH
jgi:hypothetical protein